ncbi:sugar-binding domain-containing protein [Solwaraspora sp. WMMA2065]|uniref:sugar-binding transcriptional regulator n=1 Tax=Solwaraspora sp. WMMA2065 TaxID=3015166 RepID=UPI00259B46CA|nr:sugar-binding domain-containing protein [Solwaraspora sp. WMMA2065]WJK32143.1 sugar-binding domain-containing protein [Solwaraspora sp. WMMA2065]
MRLPTGRRALRSAGIGQPALGQVPEGSHQAAAEEDVVGTKPRAAYSDDQVRLVAKVARMYHERNMRQTSIADELHISQARVSRLLKRATEIGIVRTIVSLPAGVHTDLEEAVEQQYDLHEAVVVDASSVDDLLPALGAAAADYLETTLTGGDRVGISSWSATLLAAVERMRPSRARVVDQVVQIVGGVGNPRVQVRANLLMSRFAAMTGAEPLFMPAPAMLGTEAAREALLRDPTVAEVLQTWPKLTMALVGIGSLEPSPLLLESGNALAEPDQAALRAGGAVGDVCLRFYDAVGQAVHTPLSDRILGISPTELQTIPRRVAVAGGRNKLAAIRGALLGKHVNVLITDLTVAQLLVDTPDRPTSR